MYLYKLMFPCYVCMYGTGSAGHRGNECVFLCENCLSEVRPNDVCLCVISPLPSAAMPWIHLCY